MNINLRRYGLLLVCGCVLIALNGCFVPLVAVGGFGAMKMVQGSMKSSFEVKFAAPTVENKDALAGIHVIAIWPNAVSQSSTLIAEKLEQSGKLKVVTPLEVGQVLQTNSIPRFMQDMTVEEKARVCQLVAEQTGADAVLYFSSASMRVDSRYFQFTRASNASDITAYIYSRQAKGIVWEDVVSIVVSQGSTLVSNTETEQAFANQVADKILSFAAQKPAETAKQP